MSACALASLAPLNTPHIHTLPGTPSLRRSISELLDINFGSNLDADTRRKLLSAALQPLELWVRDPVLLALLVACAPVCEREEEAQGGSCCLRRCSPWSYG